MAQQLAIFAKLRCSHNGSEERSCRTTEGFDRIRQRPGLAFVVRERSRATSIL